ncbi:YezD family protein [Fictibacillus sp. Mic-4]|nr:YezD family protein [Fictibacillus gelatini]
MGSKQEHTETIFERIKEMLETMKFGSITLVVQDGKVIQLERSEKVRIK